MVKLPALPQQVEVHKQYFDYAAAAINAHKNQTYGDLPYAYHLAMVDNYVCDYGFSDYEYRAAAWLHDTVEDTDITTIEITSSFGGTVAQLVWACTGEGETRKERNASIYRKLAAYPDAAVVKCADRYANVFQASKTKNYKKLGMYISEWEEFKAAVMPLMVNVEDKRKTVFFNELDDLMENGKKIYNEQLKKGICE